MVRVHECYRPLFLHSDEPKELPKWGQNIERAALTWPWRDFAWDAEREAYICPQGELLKFSKRVYSKEITIYRAKASMCNACPLKAKCTTSSNGRSISRSFHEEYLDRVREYHQTEAYQKARWKRQVWVEPLFAEGKQWHGLGRFRLRRLRRVNIEALLVATGQNMKRLLSRMGWGRRHFPGGAAGIVLAPLPRQLRLV